MRFRSSVLLVVMAVSLTGCRRGVAIVELDHPHLSQQVRAIDTTVHSAALGKDMPMRIVVPANSILAARELSVVYFLHGDGANFRDWTNHSDIAAFAAQGFVLVFVDAPGSYYINDLRSSKNRYEPYITQEIPAAVHAAVPTATREAARTAIVGISRGGYGALVLGLKHPELFSFIGTFSGALDFAQRGFRWKSPIDSGDVQRAFGPMGDSTRRGNDPFLLVKAVQPRRAPYFFVACGKDDSLHDPNQRLASLLARQHLSSEAHFTPGGHNWVFWAAQIPLLEAALNAHLKPSPTGQPPSPSTGAR